MSLIDEELAKKFLDDPYSVDLSQATEITLEGAKVLAGIETDLYLNGLTKISDEVAWALSKHGGGCIELKSLTEITVEAVKAFVKRQAMPDLEGIKEYSDEAYREMLGLEDLFIEVDTLSESAARILREFTGQVFTIYGLSHLSCEAVEELAKLEGDGEGVELSIEGNFKNAEKLTSKLSKFGLSSYSMGPNNEVLCKHEYDNHLTFKASEPLSELAVQNLSECKCGLSLNIEMSEEAIAAIALSGNKKSRLFIENVSNLTESMATALANYKGSHIILSPGEEQQYFPGQLKSGVDEISESTAKSIVKYNGNFLGLSCVENISSEVANILSNFEGELDLKGLHALRDKTAAMFCNRKHRLILGGEYEPLPSSGCITKISDEAREMLSKNSNIELPPLSEEEDFTDDEDDY